MQVKQASFKDGLLIVDLVREVPDAMKPRRIPIGNAAASHQSEQKAAEGAFVVQALRADSRRAQSLCKQQQKSLRRIHYGYS